MGELGYSDSPDSLGKATVQVIILPDPDGHKICFVGEEAFWKLWKMDPERSRLLADAMAEDESQE